LAFFWLRLWWSWQPEVEGETFFQNLINKPWIFSLKFYPFLQWPIIKKFTIFDVEFQCSIEKLKKLISNWCHESPLLFWAYHATSQYSYFQGLLVPLFCHWLDKLNFVSLKSLILKLACFYQLVCWSTALIKMSSILYIVAKIIRKIIDAIFKHWKYTWNKFGRTVPR